MWVRKLVDVSLTDLMWGVLQSCRCGDRESLAQQMKQCWHLADLMPCLSVRSGFDLFLSCTDWPPGSEIIMSGLTIPDMVRIVVEHGYTPVGVDLSPTNCSPSAAAVEQLITPRTRAIVVAHLFGGLCDLDAIAAVAERNGLALIEDCAQSYVGSHDLGDPRALLSMFSFGPIKTNTALGGGLLRVRNADLLNRMVSQQSNWPLQSRRSYATRLLKYSAVRLSSTRLGMRGLYQAFRCAGSNHDAFIGNAARGFPGSRFFEKIRHRPSAPQLKMLLRKIASFDSETIVQRQRRANQFLEQLGPDLVSPGSQMLRHTFWVLTLLVENRDELVRYLWKHGFDATTRCTLRPVGESALPGSQHIFDHIVFLPFDQRMSDSELFRMARLIREFGAKSPTWTLAEPVSTTTVDPIADSLPLRLDDAVQYWVPPPSLR